MIPVFLVFVMCAFVLTSYLMDIFICDAASNGDTRRVGLLLRVGANVEAEDEGWHPLTMAVQHGHLETAAFLLAHDADPNERSDSGGTPVMYAVNVRDQAMVNFLVQHGASLDLRDDVGNTAMSTARDTGDPKMVALIKALKRAQAAP